MTQEVSPERPATVRTDRLQRSLNLISACNRAIIKAEYEQTLLEQICHIVVEDGGYRLAWIGEALPDPRKSVIPRACFGFEKGYLESLDLTYEDTARGRGPTGMAIRTRRPVACQNIIEDDCFLPWREDALQREYRSALALPLLVEEQVYGTLNIYSPEPDTFDPDEIETLEKMADNLAYGIRNLRLAREKERAQRTVAESEKRYRTLFNAFGDAIFVFDLNGSILEVNDAACRSLGYCRDDLLRMGPGDFDLKDDCSPELIRELITGESRAAFESRFRNRDGEAFPVEIMASRVDYDAVPAVLWIARDISRQKEVEQELRESREMFAEYIDQLQAVAFVKDHEGRLLYANRFMKDFFGAQDWLGKMPHDYLPRSMADWVVADDRKAVEAGFIDEEGILPDRYGVDRVWRILKFVIRREDKPPLLGGILTEITEQKHLEENLRASEERYRRLFEDSILGIFRTTPEGRVLEVNPAYAAMMGYDSPEEVCRTVDNLAEDHYVNACDREWIVNLALSENGTVAMETCYRRRDGGEFTGMLHAWPVRDGLGNLLYLEGFVEDISERKKAQEALEKSEERFRFLAENARDMIYRMSLPGGEYEYVSPASTALFGHPPEEFYEKPLLIREVIAPEFLDYFEREWANLLRGEMAPSYEYRVVLPSGDEKWLSQRNSLVRDKAGRPAALEGIATDITERKEAEVLLQKQLDRTELLNRIILTASQLFDLEAVFEAVLSRIEEQFPLAFSAVVLFDPEKQILKVGATGPSFEGKEWALPPYLTFPADIENRLRGKAHSPEDLKEICAGPIRDALERSGQDNGETLALVAESELIGFLVLVPAHDRFSGLSRDFFGQLANHLALVIHGKMLYLKLQEAYLQMQQNQRSMLQQERIKALGQMASGIVHDINNAMSPITGYTDLLMEEDNIQSDKAREYLENISTAARDVIHIVSQMREFYREREEQDIHYPLDVNAAVSRTLDLTKPKWRDQPQKEGRLVIIDTDLEADLPLIDGAESEVRGALTNLVINAVDALEAEGVILIQTFVRGDRVVLTIRDNGRGMDDETRKRCLEPFFTTKGRKGTGMGLAMVYGIVQRHGGEVSIDSRPGQGTSIELRFPRSVADREIPPEKASGRDVPSRKILFIDDELYIRRLVRDMLAGDGHTVVTAEDGSEGVDLFHDAVSRDCPFDLVITDLGMPFMDGREVVEAIKKDYPQTPVILLTGWGGRLGEEVRVPEAADAVLSKPPNLDNLRRTLGEVMALGKGGKD